MSAGWLVQYRAANGAQMVTRHDSRREAFEVCADGLFATALRLWGLGGPANVRMGDILIRHAIRLTAEAEMESQDTESGDGYLLRLSEGRRWVVCPA